MASFNKMQAMHGFTLVELMISLFLGALLTAGILYVFVYNRQTYQMQDGLARVQENGRFLQYHLNREIRMAGYSGCINLANMTINNLVKNPSDDVIFDQNNYIKGYNAQGGGGWSPALATNIPNADVVPGSDAVTVRFASPITLKLKNPMQNPNNPLVVDTGRAGINAGDIILVTDCEIGDLVVAGANSNAAAITHTVANNTTNDLSTIFTTEAQVAKFNAYHFYLKPTGRTTKTGLPINGLYQKDIQGTEIELADGVEDMQILYGIDSNADGSADLFADAASVETSANWDKVISIKINLLLSTVEEVNSKQQAYTFNGTTISAPGNKKLHREWQIYTTLRNKAL